MRREDRSKSYKKGVDAAEGRRRRDDTRVQLRKNKREEGLAKRRAMSSAPAAASSFPEQTIGEADQQGNQPKQQKVYTSADVPLLLAGLSSPKDPNELLDSVRGFRRLLSVEIDPPVEIVIECGALPLFVSCLQCQDDPKVQFEAAWALTNVASTERTRAVVECGALPHLVALLRSGDADVREQCAWCLGNIAGDCTELRDAVLEAGAMESLLLNIANPGTKSLLGNVVWTVSNLCRGKPHPAQHFTDPCIPYLANLLGHDNVTVVQDACWALSYLSDGHEGRIQAVLNAGIAPRLVGLLGGDKLSLATPALRTLGNAVSGSDTQTQEVLNAGVLEKVGELLETGRKNVRKEACWLLSNIAAGTKDQLSSLLSKAEMMSTVVENAIDAEWEVRKEAVWVLSNVSTGGTDQQIASIVELGAIPALCSVLTVKDARIVLVALEAIDNILEAGLRLSVDYQTIVDECGGLDDLEELQSHENEEIYDKAITLIESYFGADEVAEDENLAPVSNGDTFSFGLPAMKNVDGVSGEEMMPQQQALQPFNFDFVAQPVAAFE
mmetsp:Transcript_22461/g.66594  ORF Transcript_22461/g.66594 Transcript_22461/m.66594 type:complete len:554 (-) Transcript_22461:307-1968(-)